MRHSDPGQGRKQLHGDVGCGANAGRSVIQASRISLGIDDKCFNGFDRNRQIDDENVRNQRDDGDGAKSRSTSNGSSL